MSRALIAVFSVLTFGCAVDDSGFGPPRAGDEPEVDGGVVVPPDAQPVDSFVPAEDGGPGVDAFVPPPDMCTGTAETCNGEDDDCDGRLDEGLTSVPCDGDADGCMDGLSGCSGGTSTCSDDTPVAGTACDGPDPDTVADGALTCVGDALVCEGDCVAMTETCDRTDQDCNGLVDDGGACDVDDVSCTSRVDGDRVYQFCIVAGGGYGHGDARSYCEDRGYDLVRVGSTSEQMFIAMHLDGLSWWSRAHVHSDDEDDRRDASQWHWSGGDDIESSLWGGGEPSGNGSCAQLRSTDGLLDDRSCSDEIGFVCEAAVES